MFLCKLFQFPVQLFARFSLALCGLGIKPYLLSVYVLELVLRSVRDFTFSRKQNSKKSSDIIKLPLFLKFVRNSEHSFLLSKIVGQPLVARFAPEKAAAWREKVNENKDDLFNYVLFLRITPFLPNWFINLTGPLVGVPLAPFFWGSVIGKHLLI